eukprot:6962097-Ditylum_brightwellii.AAC.1
MATQEQNKINDTATTSAAAATTAQTNDISRMEGEGAITNVKNSEENLKDSSDNLKDFCNNLNNLQQCEQQQQPGQSIVTLSPAGAFTSVPTTAATITDGVVATDIRNVNDANKNDTHLPDRRPRLN